MSSVPNLEAHRLVPTGPSAEQYAAFIGQIELDQVWLRSAQVDNPGGSPAPDRVTIGIEGTAEWQATETGFRAIQRYQVRFRTAELVLAEIDVAFGLDFASADPMSDTIFATFSEINLPVNVWPYLREFLSTMMGRMGWTAVTLPTYKVGTPPPSSALPGDGAGAGRSATRKVAPPPRGTKRRGTKKAAVRPLG